MELFQTVDEGETEYLLAFAGRYLVMLKPSPKEWLITAATISRVRPEDRGLPSDPERLYDRCSPSKRKNPDPLWHLIEALPEADFPFR